MVIDGIALRRDGKPDWIIITGCIEYAVMTTSYVARDASVRSSWELHVHYIAWHRSAFNYVKAYTE